MKRFLLIILLCFCVYLGLLSFQQLPADNTDKIRAKYGTWSGVIRVWVTEDMRTGAGSPVSWLNACAAITEKARDGVYINVQTVPAEAIAHYAETGVNPPDIIIYPSSLQISPGGLIPLSHSAYLRRGLDAWEKAVPILMNAHVWIYDTSAYSALPSDMYGVKCAALRGDAFALAMLSTGLRAGDTVSQSLPGVDLGLEGEAAPTPPPEGDTPCRAPCELLFTDEPRKAFLKGEAEAFVGDLRDIGYLAETSGWAACVTGTYAYADDLAMFSIIAKEDDGRREICGEYLECLLGEGQKLAARTGALPVVRGTGAYEGSAAMAGIEAGIDDVIITVQADDSAAMNYIEGKITANEAASVLADSTDR